jgi:hypothetical protein
MLRLCLLLIFSGLITGCASDLPQGMDWDSYSAALHNLKRVYTADRVAGCQQVVQLQDESFEDIAAVKDILDRKAVLAGANTIYFTELKSRPNWIVPNRRPMLYEASAVGYLCY